MGAVPHGARLPLSSALRAPRCLQGAAEEMSSRGMSTACRAGPPFRKFGSTLQVRSVFNWFFFLFAFNLTCHFTHTHTFLFCQNISNLLSIVPLVAQYGRQGELGLHTASCGLV